MPTATTRPRRPLARMIRLAALGVVTALTLTACASSGKPDNASDTESANVTIPNTPAGKKAQLVLDALNSPDDTTAETWSDVFDASFIAEVPLDQFSEQFNTQFRPAQPFTVTNYRGSDTQSITTLESPLSSPIDMSVIVTDTGQISGLFFAPAARTDPAPTSFDELQERLKEFPATVRALVYTEDGLVGDGAKAADVMLDMNGLENAPTGSAFKLYVLYALATAIDAGEASWDELLTVTDEVRSLPSGELQDQPTGTQVSVRDAAAKMIAISDNTATDMIIRYLGRERIEAALQDAGHHDPAAMTPFPATREFFQIGWGDAQLRAEWRDGDASERRAMLDRIADLPLDIDVAAMTLDDPVWVDGVEWFASPRDLARVHLELHKLESPEVSEILGANPGIQIDGWDTVQFKGGSSPGVLVGSWLVADGDSEPVLVVLQASTENAAELGASQADFFALAQSAIALAYDAR